MSSAVLARAHCTRSSCCRLSFFWLWMWWWLCGVECARRDLRAAIVQALTHARSPHPQALGEVQPQHVLRPLFIGHNHQCSSKRTKRCALHTLQRRELRAMAKKTFVQPWAPRSASRSVDSRCWWFVHPAEPSGRCHTVCRLAHPSSSLSAPVQPASIRQPRAVRQPLPT